MHDSRDKINAPFFVLSLVLSLAGVLVRWLALRKRYQPMWYLLPWLLTYMLFWIVTAWLRGAVTGLVAALGIFPHLLFKRHRGTLGPESDTDI
jgi:hypothetical protein